MGQMDDVAMWNRVLSSQEIRDLYERKIHLTGQEEGLVLFFDFDDEDMIFSSIARNKGLAGSKYDLYLGSLFGTQTTFSFVTDPTRQFQLQPPFWVGSTRPSDLPRGKPIVVTIIPSEAIDIALPALEPNGNPITVFITSLPLNGSITTLNNISLDINDTVPLVDGVFKVRYRVNQHDRELFKHDVFEYEARNTNGESSLARVFVMLNSIPQALSTNLFTIQDVAQYIRLPGTDSDGDQIRMWITHAPTRGTLFSARSSGGDSIYKGNKIDVSSLPVLIDHIGGAVYYEPLPDQSGLRNFDRFAYKAVDPAGQSSNDTWVEISVQPVNKLPTAFSKNVSTIENRAVIVEMSGYDLEGIVGYIIYAICK